VSIQGDSSFTAGGKIDLKNYDFTFIFCIHVARLHFSYFLATVLEYLYQIFKKESGVLKIDNFDKATIFNHQILFNSNKIRSSIVPFF
jgi:hypothetical protein